MEHDLREAEQIVSFFIILPCPPWLYVLTRVALPDKLTFPNSYDEYGESDILLHVQIKRMEMEARSFSPDKSRQLLTKASHKWLAVCLGVH